MGQSNNAARHKILLVDDDQGFLEVYLETLKRLPGSPEIYSASTGARALALLESEAFTLLIVDLNMPRMDGMKVLAIARRKYPLLRLMVLTGVSDEQFRARAYGMGVDQFWRKPDSVKEVEMFLEAVDALLQRESQGGFRGVQSKGLVDIIQLECLAQSSNVLRITNGVLEARIWIQGGVVTDAAAQDLTGEAAFRRILRWKRGSFELLPADPDRPRTIFSSVQGLLLESAQAIDEAGGNTTFFSAASKTQSTSSASPLAGLAHFEGVQFVMTVGPEPKHEVVSWGMESPESVSDWMKKSLESFRALGDRLQVGELQQVTGMNSQNQIALAPAPQGELCVGFRPTLPSDDVRDTMKNILAKWAS